MTIKTIKEVLDIYRQTLGNFSGKLIIALLKKDMKSAEENRIRMIQAAKNLVIELARLKLENVEYGSDEEE